MTRLLVLVEGQTEEVFVRDVLAPHLAERGVFASHTILKTKRDNAGQTWRGGVTSARQVLGELRRLLGTRGAFVTTVIDYYGLPDDFPGVADRPPGAPEARVAHVEGRLSAVVGDHRFLPHLTLHEYEAWIFSDPSACSWVFDSPDTATQLEGIRDRAGGPERINEARASCPSRQLAAVFPSYRKTTHGPMAVEAIGLAAIAARCPHAAAWLAALERLAPGAG